MDKGTVDLLVAVLKMGLVPIGCELFEFTPGILQLAGCVVERLDRREMRFSPFDPPSEIYEYVLRPS